METCHGTVSERLQSSPEDRHAPANPAAKTIDLKTLINKINYVHFLDGHITAIFRHLRYGSVISRSILPQPCTSHEMICTWANKPLSKNERNSHRFERLLIHDGEKTLVIEPETVQIDEKFLHFVLPQESRELHSRQSRRHSAKNVAVQLIQNSGSFSGSLVEFSGVSMRITLNAPPPQTFQWLNTDSPATLILSSKGDIVYSAECTILRQSGNQHEKTVVLIPTSNHLFKYKQRKYRSARQRLSPSPNIRFRHPFTDRWVELDVEDISGSGVSVNEEAHNAVLLPGLILPELSLTLANSDTLFCKAQVVYRSADENDPELHAFRCGIAFLDMKMEEQGRLLALLYQANNKHSYLSNKVDLDALWKFFFDTGFIYPEKYLHLKANKQEFKKTYRLLYEGKPNIARHFVYQKSGAILAHMSMIRFYNNSWLVQHHAAQKTETRKGGLSVLSQISRYANEVHQLYSAHLDYLFCYFRPENRFPSRVFGGTQKYINDLKGCSIDRFAYFHFSRPLKTGLHVSQTWSMNLASQNDLYELKRFLDYESGGLMVSALDLLSKNHNDSELFLEYRSLGMKRNLNIYSIKIDNELKVIVIVNISDKYLNMSDLTNSFKVMVVDNKKVSKEILLTAISILCIKYNLKGIPVLLYPQKFCEENQLEFEKIYNLWILNMQYLDKYFEFCDKFVPNINKSIYTHSGKE